MTDPFDAAVFEMHLDAGNFRHIETIGEVRLFLDNRDGDILVVVTEKALTHDGDWPYFYVKPHHLRDDYGYDRPNLSFLPPYALCRIYQIAEERTKNVVHS